MNTTSLKSFLIAALTLITGVDTVDAETQMTVNGRPATKQEKAVATQMARKGGQMAKKGVQIAATAVTNPAKAEALGEELERMGDEMERLGDSLEALADDTTFIYTDADSLELADDSLGLSADDYDDFVKGFEDGFGANIPEWAHTWWGKILAGGFGLLMGLLAIFVVILVIVFLFLLFTSPLWVIALVIWLLVRSSKTTQSNEYMRYQTSYEGVKTDTTADATADSDADAAPDSDSDADSDTATASFGTDTAAPSAAASGTSGAGFRPAHPSPSPTDGYQRIPMEHTQQWQSGIMNTCIGVGLAIFFYAIGFHRLWGIGALIACIGIAKLLIAYSQNKK